MIAEPVEDGEPSAGILVDTHLHWDQIPPDQMDAVVSRAWKAKVVKAISAATGPESCRSLLHWEKVYPDFLEIGFGLHPERETEPDDVTEVLRLIEKYRDRLSAVGEVGLPYYRLSDEERKKPPSRGEISRLEPFLRIAKELDLPLWLHAVHTRAAPVLDLLLKHGVKRAVFHWLKAPEEVVGSIVEAGYLISVTPEVCYRQRDRECIQQVPLSSILLETDAPWPFSGPFGGKPSEPAWVRHTAEAVAGIKSVSLQTVMRQTTANVARVLGKSFDPSR